MNVSAGRTRVWVWDAYVAASCIDNRGPGGYGVYATGHGQERELCGGETKTTHNRMELLAAIHAIEDLPAGSHLRLHSDATYVADGVNRYMANWKRRDWRKSDGEPVANQELWQRLDEALQRRSVEFRWRSKRGYGAYGRKLARALAQAEAQKRKPQTAGPVGRHG